MRPIMYDTVSALHLPEYVLCGLPLISIIGDREIHIENFHSILTYQPEEIRISVKNHVICVLGQNLNIHYLNPYELCIKGCLSGMTYL